MLLYKQIFDGLEFCPDPVACMTRASKGGFAYISWKVTLELFDKDRAVKFANKCECLPPMKIISKLAMADAHLSRELLVLSLLDKSP